MRKRFLHTSQKHPKSSLLLYSILAHAFLYIFTMNKNFMAGLIYYFALTAWRLTFYFETALRKKLDQLVSLSTQYIGKRKRVKNKSNILIVQ